MLQMLQRYIIITMMIVVFILLDYQLGPYVAFPVVFIIPIALTAWWYGRWPGIGIATLLSLVRIGGATTWELPVPDLMAYVIINAFMREVVFIIFVLLVERIAIQQQALKRQDNLLEGILPICSHCKKIRNKEKEWEQIESYITKRSRAEFSHSICPACMQKYYGDLRKRQSLGSG
jgi:K+-sensing histidine kinase KdpD